MTSASEIGHPAAKFGAREIQRGMQPKSPSTSRSSMSTRSPDPERSALILYGTETGNAQEVAEELGALTERLRFATHVAELNQSKPVSTVEPRSR